LVYESINVKSDEISIDTIRMGERIPIIALEFIELDPFGSETLILKWPNRFKIYNYSLIFILGLELIIQQYFGNSKSRTIHSIESPDVFALVRKMLFYKSKLRFSSLRAPNQGSRKKSETREMLDKRIL